MNTLLQDIRYALRQLRKSPAFTLTVILTLALGIGANATIFSMVSRFILRPAPMGDPKTLLSISTTHDRDQCCNIFAFPVYNDIRDQAKSFSGVAAYYALMPASIGGGGEPERVWGQGVTSNFFDVTELPMMLGRGFISGQEDAPEVVLGAGLWQRRFNADRGIIGKPVILSGRTFTVVGVVTPLFHSVDQLLGTEFWVPLGNTRQLAVTSPPQDSRDAHWLTVVGRLRPGVTRAQAAAELNTLAERFALNNPKTDQGNRFSIDQAGSLPPSQRTGVVIFLAALSVVVLLVLAIAGTNVTNLLFVRTAARERDMAIRLALGASRGQLLRQRLIESVLLGLGGGVLGVVLSLWATRSLSALHLPAPVPIDVRIDVDWRVLLFAFALSVMSGLLLGLAPAWTASRPQQVNALKGEDAHQSAQSPRSRADRHVCGSALYHRTLSSQPSKCIQHRHWLPSRTSAHNVRRPTGTRLHAGTHYHVSDADAAARCGSARCCLCHLDGCGSAIGRRPQRQLSRRRRV